MMVKGDLKTTAIQGVPRSIGPDGTVGLLQEQISEEMKPIPKALAFTDIQHCEVLG